MNDYTPKKIEVTSYHGTVETFRSKYILCKELGIQMTSLQSFIKQETVGRGRFKGWKFRVVQ